MDLSFAGTTPYNYQGGASARILVQVEVEGTSTTAALDTGAPYLICEPQVAEQLGFDASERERESVSLRTHFGIVEGDLFRATVTIPADKGESVTFEATVFVPRGEDWEDKPSFLGFFCCLERIRFALDPGSGEERFYFQKDEQTRRLSTSQ
jgi:hypothetical protein